MVWRLRYMRTRMGKAQYLSGAKGKATCKEKTTKLWPKAKQGRFWGGTQGIMVQAGAPDVASGFAGEGIIDGSDQDLRTKR